MLSKVRPGGHLYFLEPAGLAGGPARERPGAWAGRSAAADGLRDPIEPEPLAALLAGDDPGGGAALGADRRRVTVAAYDLTFCAPKSVSILHGLSDPGVREAVGGAHDRAVSAALGYVEDHALAVRRRMDGGGRAVVPVEPAPAAVFVHRTSRADDPHLHSHVLVPNLGRGPAGDWSALDGRGVYAHRAATAALYHAQLRHELTGALGVAWGPLERGRAEIAGIDREARQAFSRRSAAIAAHLADRGLALAPGGASRRAATVASFATRPEKNLAVSVDELRREWRARGREVGLGPGRLAAVLGRSPVRDGAERERLMAPEALAAALAGDRARSLTFTRRDVVRVCARSLPAGAPTAEVERAADGFLDHLEEGAALASGPGDRRRPGVAEARHALPEELRLVAGRGREDGEDHRALERLLARRQMTLGPEMAAGRALELGAGLGW